MLFFTLQRNELLSECGTVQSGIHHKGIRLSLKQPEKNQTKKFIVKNRVLN